MEYEKFEKICNIIRNVSITEASLAIGVSAVGCATGNGEFAIQAFFGGVTGIIAAIVAESVKLSQKSYLENNMSKINIPQECFCNGIEGDDDFTKQEIYVVSPSKIGLTSELCSPRYDLAESKPKVRTIGALK